jgi:hypothetical protein
MKTKVKGFLVFISLLIFICFPVYSQSRDTGAIEGKVTGHEGDVLPGVGVTISSPNYIGGSQNTITNEYGRFRFVGLPPGTYSVEAKLEGFKPQKTEDLRVSVGMTLTVDFKLEVSALEESVEVIGRAPIIDVKDSTLATINMKQEFLEKVPTSRTLRDELRYAPGVVGTGRGTEGTGRPVAYGSEEAIGNSYLIDGIKANSPEAGELEINIDYDSLQEINILGLGAPAEYDEVQGLVMQAVTKSGGNAISCLANFYFQLPGFHSENWQSYPYLLRKQWNETYNFHLNVGGPVIKDKIWFYVNGRYDRSYTHIEDYAYPTPYGWTYRISGKLTWQPDKNNRISALLEYSREHSYNDGAGPLVTPEAVTQDLDHEMFYSSNLLHVFSATTFLEVRIGGYNESFQPTMDKNVPCHIDLGTQITSGNYPEFWIGKRWRDQLNATLTHHAEDFIKGAHDFKFGVEAELSEVRNYRAYPGGKRYFDFYGQNFKYIQYEGYDATPKTLRTGAFVQDSWIVGKKLTINPGIRINYWRGSLPGMGAVFTPKIGIAPRLGLNFDIFGDHSTILKIHYGKYYHNIIGMFFLHLQPQGAKRDYYWGPSYDELFGLPAGTHGNEWVMAFEELWVNKYTVDPNLKMPYENNFVVGLEREVMKDVSVGLSFMNRSGHDFLDRVNITGEWEPIEWQSPYGDGQTYTVYKRLNPGDNQYYITNPKAGNTYGAAFPGIVPFTPTRKYRALIFTFNKRYSNRWQLNVSYTYSKASGYYDTVFGEYAEKRTDMLGASTLFSNPNWQINSDGLLTGDHPHVLKIMGSWDIPFVDCTFGFLYWLVSGSTYDTNLYLPIEIDPDSCSTGFWTGGFSPSAIYIFGEKRGSFRYPTEHNLDLRLEKFFKFGGKMKITAYADLFNALNSNTITRAQDTIDPYTEYKFGYVWNIRTPRTYHLGFRFEF